MKHNTKRNFIQLAAAVFFNGCLTGFQKGKIFQGKTKSICLPVLNCYSCPGALGACPIGSLQSMFSGHKYRFSFYVLGYLMLFGILLGRGICGILCPFGLIQGLLYRIPLPWKKAAAGKKKRKKSFSEKEVFSAKADRCLRYLKYVVLLVMVILLPLFLKDQYGIGTTYFCKYICPAGTLEAGIPMLLANKSLRMAIGSLFHWKMAVLIGIVVLAVLIYRPFCKYLCPLGAIYALFNRFSFFQLELDRDTCVDCKACEQACLMKVDITKNINSAECIRCGKCMDICPKDAIHVKRFVTGKKPPEHKTGEAVK